MELERGIVYGRKDSVKEDMKIFGNFWIRENTRIWNRWREKIGGHLVNWGSPRKWCVFVGSV